MCVVGDTGRCGEYEREEDGRVGFDRRCLVWASVKPCVCVCVCVCERECVHVHMCVFCVPWSCVYCVPWSCVCVCVCAVVYFTQRGIAIEHAKLEERSEEHTSEL